MPDYNQAFGGMTAAGHSRGRAALWMNDAPRFRTAVGTATNYHADWMVPYRRDAMTKVAQVGNHLFYAPGLSAAALPARKGGEG